MDDSLSQTAGERIDSLRGLDEKSEQPDNDGSVGLADAIRQKAGLDTKVWVPYQGPEGGEGWQDLDGNVRYTSDPPGDTLDPADLDAGDVADMSDEEFDTLLESVATMTDDPGGFAEDLAKEVGMDARDEGVVDAVKDDPDAIRRAAEGRGADLGGDGETQQYGNLSDAASDELADASDDEVRDAAEYLLGGDYEDLSGDELREEFGSSMASESEILDAIGSDEEAVIDQDDLNAAMDAVTNEVRGNTDEITYDTVSETLSRDDSPVDADSDLVNAVAEEFGVERNGGDGGDGGGGDSGDALDDEGLSSAVEDAFEESGADDPAAFSEDVMNELGYGTRDSIEGEGVTEADVQEAVDSVTGGGNGGDEVNTTENFEGTLWSQGLDEEDSTRIAESASETFTGQYDQSDIGELQSDLEDAGLDEDNASQIAEAAPDIFGGGDGGDGAQDGDRESGERALQDAGVPFDNTDDGFRAIGSGLDESTVEDALNAGYRPVSADESGDVMLSENAPEPATQTDSAAAETALGQDAGVPFDYVDGGDMRTTRPVDEQAVADMADAGYEVTSVDDNGSVTFTDANEGGVDQNADFGEKAETGDIDHSQVYNIVADAYDVTPDEAEETLHDAFGVNDKSGGPDTDEKADFGGDDGPGVSLIEKARASTNKRYRSE